MIELLLGLIATGGAVMLLLGLVGLAVSVFEGLILTWQRRGE